MWFRNSVTSIEFLKTLLSLRYLMLSKELMSYRRLTKSVISHPTISSVCRCLNEEMKEKLLN